MNQHYATDPVASSAPRVDDRGGAEPLSPVSPAASLAALFGVLRRSIWRLALWTVCCVGLMAVYLHRASPEFVAYAQVVLEPRRQIASGSEANPETLPPLLDSAQADSQVQVVKSERNLRFVFETKALAEDPTFRREPGRLLDGLLTRFGFATSEPPSPATAARATARAFQNFADRVGVRRIGQSYALEISYRGPDGATAARLANAITAAYIRDQIMFKAASVQRGTEFLQGRIAEFKSEQDLAVEAVKTGHIPDVEFADSDARVVSAATEPLTAAFPQPSLMLAAAGLFGLFTGGGVVAIRHSLDRRLYKRDQIGAVLDVRCLAVLPRLRPSRGGWTNRSDMPLTVAVDSPTAAYAEALRGLRTAIVAATRNKQHRAIGVVSWSSGEGRSSVAGNLATLIAASRLPVVLMDADFRRPTLSQRLAPGAESGLNEALMSDGPDRQPSIVEIQRGLFLVPALAGGSTIDPNAFLGSEAMHRLLLALRRDREVIVDLPAMSVSSDVQAIGPMLDGVVLLADHGRTRLDDLLQAIRALRDAHVTLLGVVLNKAAGDV